MGAAMTVEPLRVAVYRRFAHTGQAATVPELAEQFGVAEASVRAGLRELAAGRHLVLDDQDRILMAHPFSEKLENASAKPCGTSSGMSRLPSAGNATGASGDT